jgi:hypothetical protein
MGIMNLLNLWFYRGNACGRVIILKSVRLSRTSWEREPPRHPPKSGGCDPSFVRRGAESCFAATESCFGTGERGFGAFGRGFGVFGSGFEADKSCFAAFGSSFAVFGRGFAAIGSSFAAI